MPHFHRFHRWFATVTFLGGLFSCQGNPIHSGRSTTIPPSVQASSRPTASPGTGPVVSTPGPSLSPTSTQSLPPGTISIFPEGGSSPFFCEPLAENPKLIYPTDLAVTKDGQTIYVSNIGCRSPWGGGVFQEDVLPGCVQPYQGDDRMKRQVIFRINAGTKPEILLKNSDPLLSCFLGQELEMDSKENLYFSSFAEPGFIRLSPPFEQRTFVRISKQASNAYYIWPYGADGGAGGYAFGLPSGFQLEGNNLYFELFAQADFSDYRIRKSNLETNEQLDQLGVVSPNIRSHLQYAVSQGRIYILSLLDFDKDSTFSYDAPSILTEYWRFPASISGSGVVEGESPPRWRIPLDRQPNILIHPHKLRAGPNGVFYLSDVKNHQIWTITLNTDHSKGELRVLAGSGQKGYKDGKGTEASFYVPSALSFDGAGNLYVADTGNSAIRKVTPEGVVTTFYKAPD